MEVKVKEKEPTKSEGAYQSGYYSGKTEAEAEITKLQEENDQLRAKVAEQEIAASEMRHEIARLRKQLEKPATAINQAPTRADGKIQWRKIGGGSMRLAGGQIIKTNQVFWATIDEIPKIARDRFVVPVSGELPKPPPLNSATKYKLEEKGAGWWNVINIETEKPINEKGLRKPDAEELLKELS
ncbi:MAG: hypothetical protein V3U75_13050 [Methylococcaceae bacterium]